MSELVRMNDQTHQVLCCGLSCLDVELHRCDVPASQESVTTFQGTHWRAGGSAPQTALALHSLNVHVAISTALGNDSHATKLVSLSEPIEIHRAHGVEGDTAVAYLPLFKNGTRACYIDLGVNLHVSSSCFALPPAPNLRVFHFGYPHLMPNVDLAALYTRVRRQHPNTMFTLDINGATKAESSGERQVLKSALSQVAFVHANLDEACLISELYEPTSKEIDPDTLLRWFTGLGAAIILITCGKNGVFGRTGSDFATRTRLSPKLTQNAVAYHRAYALSSNRTVNASGAGDAFCAGVIASLASYSGGNGLSALVDSGLASAAYRLDPSLVHGKVPENSVNMTNLTTALFNAPRIEPEVGFPAIV